MAEVTIAAGAIVDLATKSDLQHHHDLLKSLLPQKRVANYKKISGQVAVGSGPLIITLNGSPSAGRLWAVQWITIFPDDPATATVANVAAAVTIGSMGTATVTSSESVVVAGLTIPTSVSVPDATYVRSIDYMRVRLAGTGLAAGTTIGYNAVAGVLEAADDPETYTWLS